MPIPSISFRLAIVAMLAIFGSSAKAEKININNPADREKFIELIKNINLQAAQLMQKQLPFKQGNVTTTAVIAAGLRVVYKGTIDMDKSEIDYEAFKKQIISNLCAIDATKPAAERELFRLGHLVGYERQYIDVDKNGDFVGSFVVDKDSCVGK